MAAMEEILTAASDDNAVPDCTYFPEAYSTGKRAFVLLFSGLAGAMGGLAILGADAPLTALWAVIGIAVFAGGLLSTWSPCGYSSISLLRPDAGRSGAKLAWLPTFVMHGLGYAAGAVILGSLLGAIGGIFGFAGLTSGLTLGALALVGLAYGAHQLDLLRVPYPQRRAQVPHDARQRFPKWVIGGLYGLSLGLDYLTYVQTPLLYLVTLAAVFTGNITHAIALIAIFNLGRYLPVAVNLTSWKDHQIQSWLARNQERAALVDGAILTALGAAIAVFAFG